MIVKQRVRVDGLTEVKEALRAIPEGVRVVIGGYAGLWADETLSETRRRAPKGETGDLEGSYDKNVRDDGLQVAVGSDLHRAKFTELGTRKSRPRPHLYPAFRLANRAFRNRIKNTITDLGKVRTRVKRLKKPRKRA